LVGCMLVSLATGVTINDHVDLKFDTFVGTSSSVGIMAALVSVMTDRESKLRAALEQVASTDPLTGLLNRRAFDPRLQSMSERAKAAGSTLTVVMFDLDHFKRFNDQHGHMLGDRALLRTAEVLRAQSRGDDAVSRFGGEEFAVALADCDRDEARAYTDRVAVALATCVEDERLAVSVSAGICELDPCADGPTLLARADAALYAAKQAGRARAAWWSDGRYVDAAFDLPRRVPRLTLPGADRPL
jgi:diguanylate cyclase (GGDEF)-like protein